MPVTIKVNHDNKYALCRYIGNIKDDELLASWKNFYESDDWIPGMPELIDLSEFENITSNGLQLLADYCEKVYLQAGLEEVEVSVMHPNHLVMD